MSERTLVLIKPDAVRRGLIGEVLSRIERKGLQITTMDMRVITAETAEAHYAEHVGKPFFPSLIVFITSGPLVALVVAGSPGRRGLPRTGRRDRPGAGERGHYPR